MESKIASILKEGSELRIDSIKLIPKITEAISLMTDSLKNNNKILICGNGGSSSQSDHFSAELIGRYEKEGKAINCISLTIPAVLTAISNDYGFEYVFSRQIEAIGNKGDILIAITTSDFNQEDKHSINIKNAIEKAKIKGLKTIGLFSIKSEKIQNLVDIPIMINSKNTARIQEMHITILHIFALFLEENLR